MTLRRRKNSPKGRHDAYRRGVLSVQAPIVLHATGLNKIRHARLPELGWKLASVHPFQTQGMPNHDSLTREILELIRAPLIWPCRAGGVLGGLSEVVNRDACPLSLSGWPEVLDQSIRHLPGGWLAFPVLFFPDCLPVLHDLATGVVAGLRNTMTVVNVNRALVLIFAIEPARKPFHGRGSDTLFPRPKGLLLTLLSQAFSLVLSMSDVPATSRSHVRGAGTCQ